MSRLSAPGQNVLGQEESQLGLTHLSELVVDQQQPGDVQVVQVVAAVALGVRRLDAALLLLLVVDLTAQGLWQQPGANTKMFAELINKIKPIVGFVNFVLMAA